MAEWDGPQWGQGPERDWRPPQKGGWRHREWRFALMVLVWAGALGWSVYLLSQDYAEKTNGFARLVGLMGSTAILYLLFLATRPVKSSEGDEAQREPTPLLGDTPPDGPQVDSSATARWALITITLALTIGGIAYRVMQDNYLHQTSLFFIGLPAVLAITLAMTPRAKSATGMILKGLTLGLLLSGIVLNEGFICILMAAPLFYAVGVSIGIPIDRARRRRQSHGRVYSLLGLGLVLLSVEGAVPATSFSPHEVVTVSAVVDGSARAVRQALARTPKFDDELPFYLRLGFPRPVGAHGSGLQRGDRRTILFGTESPMEPMTPAHDHHEGRAPSDSGGELILEVALVDKGKVVFAPVSDSTAFTHWISWGRSVVTWEAVDEDTTEVTWTMHFKRRLSPAWYFRFWERYAAEKAAAYLIQTAATP